MHICHIWLVLSQKQVGEKETNSQSLAMCWLFNCSRGGSMASWMDYCSIWGLCFLGHCYRGLRSEFYCLLWCLWVSEWVKSLSRVWLFATPWTVAHQALPPMGFSRQGYWSGLPFPSPGELPDPGIEPRFPALQAGALPSEPPGNWEGKCQSLCFFIF